MTEVVVEVTTIIELPGVEMGEELLVVVELDGDVMKEGYGGR